MITTTDTDRHRLSGYSLLEAAIVVGLLLLLSVWVLPRFVADEVVVSDRTAQAHAEMAVDAALAVRRDTGAFDPDVTTLRRYVVDLDVVDASTEPTPGNVSVHVSVAAQQATVTAVSAGEDGVCWATRRAFGTESFTAVYAYAVSGLCTADRAGTLEPDPARPELGTRWSRPLELGP